MRESSVSFCPVPTEQQPIHEYQQLKESWFFRWAKLELGDYALKLAWVWGLSWLIAGPVAAASFAPHQHLVQFMLAGGAGAGLFLTLVLLRLYLGWSYVRDRLSQETIGYEESGWYDGQTWTKPPDVLNRDRLIVSYQVQPILQRLQRTLGLIAILIVSGSLLWNLS